MSCVPQKIVTRQSAGVRGISLWTPPCSQVHSLCGTRGLVLILLGGTGGMGPSWLWLWESGNPGFQLSPEASTETRLTRTQQNRQLLRIMVSLLLVCGCSAQIQAQQADQSSDEQARETIEQALRMVRPGPGNAQLKIRHRQDLEEDLSNIAEKPVRDVYFYELQSPPQTAFDDDSIRVIAVTRSTGGLYQLYNFEDSEGFSGPSEQFNRLIYQLTLSISNDRATSLARFFLACCVGGELNEIVLGEGSLRHAVERHYVQSYGDIWRALGASWEWWEGFQKNPPDLAPTIRFENDRYHVVLKRVLMVVGKHPQLQEWEFEVSRNGSVRILAMQPIFPKQTRWLFYDFRSKVAPAILSWFSHFEFADRPH